MEDGRFVPTPTFEVEVTKNTLRPENVQVVVPLLPVPHPEPVQESTFILVNRALVEVMEVAMILVEVTIVPLAEVKYNGPDNVPPVNNR